MSVVEELRPVEALDMLSKEGLEIIDERTSLVATTTYLGLMGFLTVGDNGFETVVGLDVTDLRDYERDLLDRVSEGDEVSITYPTRDRIFRDAYMETLVFFGYLEKEIKRRVVLEDKVTLHKTDKFYAALDELRGIASLVIGGVAANGVDDESLAFAFSFPSRMEDELSFVRGYEKSDLIRAIVSRANVLYENYTGVRYAAPVAR
tara:strand:- start:240 stop:854 length:615 start_codon:yes stop_codon:yes gene_type:complete